MSSEASGCTESTSPVAQDVRRFARALDAFLKTVQGTGLGGDVEAMVANQRYPAGAVPPLVQQHFSSAAQLATTVNPSLSALVQALAALVAQLHWHKRPSDGSDAGFDQGHFNAIIIGNAGAVAMGPLLVGVSVMAPGVTYPMHRHPPEERYVVLSPGQWWREQGGWWTPGIGNLVHNPSNQLHSMRSAAQAHLSIWVLTGAGAAGFASGS
ncbi:hypothetical protein D3C81_419350 [compost metagenome]